MDKEKYRIIKAVLKRKTEIEYILETEDEGVLFLRDQENLLNGIIDYFEKEEYGEEIATFSQKQERTRT